MKDKPAPSPRNADGRTLYFVSCSCGATVQMDARGFGRPVVCRKCRESFTVGWGKDPRTQKSTPVTVPLAKKKAPLLLVCVCGYRRPVSPAEATERNRCPGCGKDMIVEKPAVKKAQKAARAPIAPAAPPVPKKATRAEPAALVIEVAPGTHQIRCSCGERLFVPADQLGKLMKCDVCDRRMKVVVSAVRSRESTFLARPPIPEKRALPATPVPKAPATPSPASPSSKKPSGMYCLCGQAIDMPYASEGSEGTCGACGRAIRMGRARDPQTMLTILRPVFGPATPPPAPPAPRTSAPPPPETLESADFSEEPAPAPEEEPEIVRTRASSLQEVFCPCGEALMVAREDAGKNMQCPTCFTLMAVEEHRDTSGEATLRVRAIGKMDEDTWSLNDFS